MLSIGDYLGRVRTAQAWAAAENERTDKNVYLSDFAKKEAKDAIAANLHDSVTGAVHGLFGKMGPTGLEGGDFGSGAMNYRHACERRGTRPTRWTRYALATPIGGYRRP